MTRQLLQQALEAMQEIYFYILSSNNNLPYKKLQEGIEAITAALAQPEPLNVWREAVDAQCSVAYIWLYEDDPKKTIENLIERHCELVTKPNGSNL